jgi:hypothetical protein
MIRYASSGMKEKKTPRKNVLHKMKPINNNFNYFGSQNHRQWPLFLFSLEFEGLLSLISQTNDWKIRKMNFSTKIEFLKTKGTNHL